MDALQTSLSLMTSLWPILLGIGGLVITAARVQWRQRSLESADKHRRQEIEKHDQRIDVLEKSEARLNESVAALQGELRALKSETVDELKRIGQAVARIEGRLEGAQILPQKPSR